MGSALTAGVTGLQVHQTMLDVAGNNLANINTTAYKSSQVTFSELLSETIQNASQPTSTTGGTNPQQVGSGVGISSISKNMTQGSIVETSNELDMALEGEGFFVVSDGSQSIYTRVGAFSVDADSNLVDSSGYIVQRIGTTGEADGFQTPGDSNISIPYDTAIPASATSEITVTGNLSSDAISTTTQTNVLESNIALSTTSGGPVTGSTTFAELSSGTYSGATITVTGVDHDGSDLGSTDITIADDGSTTLDDVLTSLNTILGGSATATLSNGTIVITDTQSGYSLSDINLEFNNSGTADVEMPGYFEISTVGGDQMQNIDITIYDSLGSAHVLSGTLVKTNTDNTWDLVLTSLTGDVEGLGSDERRISGITFNAADGSYAGLSGSDTTEFSVVFGHDPSTTQTIELSLGTVGQMDGLTQFAGNSTAVASGQDGYQSGSLSSLSVTNDGILVGTFTNGIKKEIAALQVAVFKNTAGLKALGSGYYAASANSGDAIATQAMSSGAGTIYGNSLEQSNADVASEFVKLIQAQNGYQANARTIQVANDILSELTNLIR